MGAASKFDDERKRAGYRSGMMTDSCNEDMMSSRPPTSIGHAQDESVPEPPVENIPRNVISMSSGWITSDAIRSGEVCKGFREVAKNVQAYSHIRSISASHAQASSVLPSVSL